MTEQQLNEYSIYMLREVARNVGVASPTSKKKQQLIKEILEITEGKKAPTEKTKQGRPPKNFGYSFADMIVQPKSTQLMFMQEQSNEDEQDGVVVSGYVEQVNLNTAYLWVKVGTEYCCYFIPAQIYNKLNLKFGDLVNAQIGVGEEKMMVKEVLSINGIPINKYDGKRKDFDKISHSMPNKKIPFESISAKGVGAMFGENVYLYGNNNNQNTSTIVEMLNGCGADKKIYINLSIAEKNKYFLNSIEGAELFVASIMEGPERARKIISLAIERAKRICENGENVVLFIDDVISLWSIDEINHNQVKKLMSITKNGGKKGSVSLFAIMSGDNELKVFEKLADKRIILN